MVGEIIATLLACVLIGELLVQMQRLRRMRDLVRRRLLLEERPAPEGPCAWPRLEPEVEELRRKALL